MGGEITWTCQSNGRYVFEVKIYRDCNGITLDTNAGSSIILNTTTSPSNITCTLYSHSDNSPKCASSGPAILCANGSFSNPVPGAVEEFIYHSNQVQLPSSVPPASGWVFWYSSSARNMAISNLVNPSSTGFTLRTKMFAYNGRLANPCFDNSPRFYEIPRTVICAGYPFVFNHNAVDNELDSLVYSWDHPLDAISGGGFSPVNLQFASPYTYNNPLPGPSLNPNNVAAVLDPFTGEVSYTSFTTGTFVLVIKVTAYKCQTKIAEIYREIQVVLNVCSEIQPGFPNNPPVLAPPFPDASGSFTLYVDTIYAGQNVHFTFSGQDVDADANFNFQNLSLTASGLEFDPTFSNPNGACLHQPCATLSPSPVGYTSQITYSTTFDWNTSCDQLGFNQGCRTFSNIYHFVFKFFDDFCPVPGISTATVTIVLLPPPLVAPPKIKCTSVLPNGDVTLSWVPPVDTAGTFISYNIYYSPSLFVPFTLIDSVTNFAQTSYTHVGAGADNSMAYYYFKIKSGCDDYAAPDNFTDTIKAMKLTVQNNHTGYAHLSWNSTTSPLIPTNGIYHYVYREYPPGNWTIVDSVEAIPGTNIYDDPITICDDTVKYRVEVQDSSGCRSVSSIAGDVFQDLIPPFVPRIDSVSVNASGLATIAWIQNSSQDTHAYVIYTQNGGSNWVALDTVYGINNIFYPTVLDASVLSRPFRVLAIDSCGNPSAMGDKHNTVHLTASLDICQGSIALSWNPYINWPAGVVYGIYASENGGAPVLLDTTTLTVFSHDHLTQHSTYCYFIRAIDETTTNRTSSSNAVCVTARILVRPNYSYIHTATITGDKQVILKAYVDINADVTGYKILRAEAGNANFSNLAFISSIAGNPNFSFTDYTAETNKKSYFYKVIAVDSCGQDVYFSDVARTIYLNVTPNEDITNTIEWNDYEVWLGGVDHYKLYRTTDGVSDGVISNVAFGSGHVIDDVSGHVYSQGKFCYYVEAFEGSGDSFGFRDTSRSNETCISQKPIVFVANAFHPGGNSALNNEFNPFKAFINGTSFTIDIYNRWGENVFHNTDPLRGWDGTFKGQAAPEGVYIYFMKVSGSDHSDIERKGSITLFR